MLAIFNKLFIFKLDFIDTIIPFKKLNSNLKDYIAIVQVGME